MWVGVQGILQDFTGGYAQTHLPNPQINSHTGAMRLARKNKTLAPRQVMSNIICQRSAMRICPKGPKRAHTFIPLLTRPVTKSPKKENKRNRQMFAI